MSKNIKVALRTYLLSQSKVTQLVGDRIYATVIPQNATYPCVSVSTVSEATVKQMSGYSSGLADARIQLDCWAENEDAAFQVADLIRNYLDGYSGTVANIQLDSVTYIDKNETVEPQGDGSDIPISRISVDYRIWYVNNAPFTQ